MLEAAVLRCGQAIWVRGAGVGLALVLAMTVCNFGDILLTTHTNFMKMKMGLSIRVRAESQQSSCRPLVVSRSHGDSVYAPLKKP